MLGGGRLACGNAGHGGPSNTGKTPVTLPRAVSDVQTLFSPSFPRPGGEREGTGYRAPKGGEALRQEGPFPVSPPHAWEQGS